MKNIIILPTYNEKENITKIIPKIFSIVPDIFILVVDDNSPDGTANEVVKLQSRFPNLKLYKRKQKEGLGRAYIDAIKKILEQNPQDLHSIFTMDADCSHEPERLPIFLKEIENNDLVIGSRYIKEGKIEGWELWRKILSRGGNFYCKIITRMPIADCTSGFNCIRADFLRKIDLNKLSASGYAFLMEIKYLFWKANGRIKEIPIEFLNREGGESKLSNHIINEGILTPWRLLKIKK